MTNLAKLIERMRSNLANEVSPVSRDDLRALVWLAERALADDNDDDLQGTFERDVGRMEP